MKHQILHRLASVTRSDIEAIPLPRVADIEQANRQRMLEKLERAMASDPLPLHAEMVEELVRRGHTAEQIAAALLGMSYLGRLSAFEASPAGLTLRP